LTDANSNPLREALARTQADSAHPDADLLNAFTEGALQARERDALMAHLAHCADCRHVAGLASDAAPLLDARAGVIGFPPQPRFAVRAWMPVAAAVAAIAVTSAIAFHSASSLNSSQSTNASRPPAPENAPQAEPRVRPLPDNTQHSMPSLANGATARVNAAHPLWRINGQGQLERSLNDGQWTAVLGGHGQVIHVLSVSGQQLWAGGDHSRIYHSTDDGQTWKVAILPPKNGADHSIAHVRSASEREIRINASDGTEWTSTDGGVTWR
jgi:hypothetical protein